MFDEWLTFPSNGVAWAFQIFTKYGPVPIMLAIFIIMVPFRPQVPKAVPMHHRRALLQMEWTFRVALSFALIAVMLSPAALISLYNSGLLTQNAFNSMNTMLVLVVGVTFQLPYLLMVHVWFPRPLNWVPNRNWVISPRFRVRAWIVYFLIWMATEIMMVVGGVVFEKPNASIPGEEILAAAGYYLIEGIIFLAMSVYIQYRISWRNPIPGVPLAVDMALRREELNSVQKFATFILGAGVSRCLQFLAQLQYESGPFAISAISLVLSWVVSLTSLGIACIPTWWFMRKLDPSRRLMKALRNNVMSEKRDPSLFTLENFRNMLDYDEGELIKGSIPPPRKNLLVSTLENPQKDLLTAPGSGSAPEEVAQAFTYMSKVAARAGVGLSPEERKGLAEIREAVRELVEHRVALNEGVASNLIPISPNAALAQDDEHGETVELPEGQEEDGEPLDSGLAHLLGQSVNDTAVGLDSQTLQEWGEFYKEKDEMERQEKAWEKQKEMQELAIKAFGFDPYAYDPYGYGNPYGGSANPYAEFGTDPYVQFYADGYSYGMDNSYAELYGNPGYSDPYGGYGYDPYGYNAGYWQMNPNMAGAYGAYPWGWPNGAPTLPNPQPYGYLDAGGANGAAGEAPGNPAGAPGAGPEGSMFSGQSAAGPQGGAFPAQSASGPLSPGGAGAGEANPMNDWPGGGPRNAESANQPGGPQGSVFPAPGDPFSPGGIGTGEANPMNDWPGGGPRNAESANQPGGPQVPGFGTPAGPGVPGSAPVVPGGAPLGPGMTVPGAPAGVGAPMPNNPTNHVDPVNPAVSEHQAAPGYPFVVRTMEGYSTVGAPVAPSLHPLVNWGQPGPQVPGAPVNPGQPVPPANPGFPQTPGLVNPVGPNASRPPQPYTPANTEAVEEAIDPRAVYPPTFAKPRPAPRQYEEFVEDEAEIEELP